jgi:hypothetical protein
METKKRTRDKRKILLVLPLMLMPFMALAFYGLGGGRGKVDDSALASKGINTALPDASFKSEEPVDKMGYYAKAPKDTASDSSAVSKLMFSAEDSKTAEINSKLAALNREINAPVASVPDVKVKQNGSGGDGNSMKNDVDRLELLMKSMQEGKQKDPEMEQMNSVLEKILDIQNPARAQQKVLGKIYSGQELSKFSAIAAVIAGNQKVVQGASVKLKLMDSVLLGGVMVPKGHFLYGLCRITNQRLLLDIKNVRLGKPDYPC